MRHLPMMIFFLLFAVAVTLIAVSHFIEAIVEMPTQYPTGREWRDYRQKAEALEAEMQQCKDPVELEKLYRQHFDLTEQWKQRIKPIPEKERTAIDEDQEEDHQSVSQTGTTRARDGGSGSGSPVMRLKTHPDSKSSRRKTRKSLSRA